MQIHPVVLVGKTELTESNDRFFGRKVKQYPVAFSLGKGGGVDTQQQTGISGSVDKVQRKFGILVTHLARKRASEYRLRIAGPVDHSSLQTHPGRILTDGKENSIEQQRVGTQAAHFRTSVDTPLGRKAKPQGEIVKRHLLGGQEIADRIFLAGCARRW